MQCAGARLLPPPVAQPAPRRPSRPPPCRAAAGEGDDRPSAGDLEALKRIKAARGYKDKQQQQQQQQTEQPEQPEQRPQADADLAAFAAQAQAAADAEAAAFQAALQAQEQRAAEAAAAGPDPEGEKQRALLEKLDRAKKYKLTKGGALVRPPPSAAAAAAAAPQPPAPPPPPPPPPPAEGGDTSDDERRYGLGGGGTASTAATWLQTDNSAGLAAGLDRGLRAEEFAEQKAAAARAAGGEVLRGAAGAAVSRMAERTIKSDDDYNLASQMDEANAAMAADELHRPKVATWGVFPRPRNISEAYGGGRNLPPGQALESEEAAAERDARVAARLSAYKLAVGAEADPAAEAAASALLAEGEALLRAGALPAALAKLEAAAAQVPLRCKVGGQVALQRAICLDSLGRSDEAYAIYSSIRSHTAPGVSKSARRMLFGFTAAQELKVDKMASLAPPSEDWAAYFARAQANNWALYKRPSSGKEGGEAADAEEEARAERAAAAVAAAVVLVPLGLLAVLVAR